jgi:hypothetical protein
MGVVLIVSAITRKIRKSMHSASSGTNSPPPEPRSTLILDQLLSSRPHLPSIASLHIRIRSLPPDHTYRSTPDPRSIPSSQSRPPSVPSPPTTFSFNPSTPIPPSIPSSQPRPPSVPSPRPHPALIRPRQFRVRSLPPNRIQLQSVHATSASAPLRHILVHPLRHNLRLVGSYFFLYSEFNPFTSSAVIS